MAAGNLTLSVSGATTYVSTSNLSTYTTGVWPVSNGNLLVVSVALSGSVSAGSLTDSLGGRYTLATTALYSTSANKVFVWVRNSPVSGASLFITNYNTDDAATGIALSMVRIANASKWGSGVIVRAGSRQNLSSATPILHLPAAADSSSFVLTAIGADSNPPTITPNASFTEYADVGYATPSNGIEVTADAVGQTTATVGFGSNLTAAFGGVIVEITSDPNYGTSSTTNAADGASITGVVGYVGASNTTNAADTSAASGSVAQSVTGTSSTTNANDTSTGTAIEAVVGSAAVTNGGGAAGPTNYTAGYNPDDPGGVAVSGADVTDLYDLKNANDWTQSVSGERMQLETTVDGTDALDRDDGDGYASLESTFGVSDVFDIPATANAASERWSVIIECWPSSTGLYASPQPDQVQALLTDRTDTDSGGNISVGFKDGYAVCSRFNTSYATVEAAAAFSNWGARTFITAGWDGSNLIVRVDKGTRVTQALASAFGITPQSHGLSIGRSNGGYYRGQIGRMRFFNYVVTDQQSDDTQDEWTGTGGVGDTVAASGVGNTVTGSSSTTNAADTSAASATVAYTGTSSTTNANDASAASGTVGSEAVTGSSATTNANDTSAASATVAYTGTSSTTNAADTSAASGVGNTVTGSSSTTNAADTSSASARVAYTGTASTTNAADTSAASGVGNTVTGSLSRTNAADTSAASATVAYTGTSSTTNAADTSTASATVAYTGSSATTNAADTSTASGLAVNGVGGSLATTNANDTSAASGVGNTVTGSSSTTNAADTSTASATVAYTGTSSTTNAADTSAASATVAYTGTSSTTNAADASAASATVAYTGTSSTTNATDTASASGFAVSGVGGSSATANAADTSTASGTVAYTGSSATTNAADTSSASGSTAGAIAGSSATTNAADTSSASARAAYTGSSATTNAADASTATGAVAYTGSSSTTNAADSAAAQAVIAVVCAAAAANINDSVTGSGVVAYTGTATATPGNDTLAAIGLTYDNAVGASATTNAADTASATGAQTVFGATGDFSVRAAVRSWTDSTSPVSHAGKVLYRTWNDSADPEPEPVTRARTFSDSG